jgi:hypothetical protein
MKKIYGLLLLQIILGEINAQPTPCDSTPANCNWDLRTPIFERVFEIDGDSLTVPIVYGNGTNANYHDVAFKLEEDGCINADACTGNAENYPDTLKIFVYYPKHDYSATTGCKLPPFIFAHAGGFSDCNRLSSEGGSATFCRYMAARGFVVFSIEYRSGRLIDQIPKVPPPNTVFYNSVFQNSASYRAMQDIRGAIRYIIYRELNHGSGGINDAYRIDLTNIFLGGASAGAVAMLSASYYYQTSGQGMLNDAYPAQGSNISTILGNINIDFYLGNDNLNYMQAVKGICNLWGSVNVPTDYFTGTPHPKDFFANLPYKPPVIGFCGRQDKVFNYNYQPVYYSPYDIVNTTHNFYNRTAYCLNPSYILEGTDDDNADIYNIGAAGFYNMVLQPLGIFSEIYLDCQMKHGLDGNDNCGTCTSDPDPFKKLYQSTCTICGYKSNFGVPTANTTELTYNYIASRVATFFQAILSKTTGNVSKTSFVECENYRHNCGNDSYSTTNCLSGCSSN